MKWPCSLQYVGVFPKYLYTNRWSAFTTAKCEIRCEMHWNAQRSKPNWDLFLHALRRSVCGRDLSVVPLTFCIFVERTSKIMNNYYKSIGWRTFQLTSKSFSLSFHKSAANWHWHQTSALLSLFGSPKKNIVYRDGSVSLTIPLRRQKSVVEKAVPDLLNHNCV